MASAFTETPPAGSAENFLSEVKAGKCEARGHGGTPLALSHGLYNTVASYLV